MLTNKNFRRHSFCILLFIAAAFSGGVARASAINECIDSCFNGFSCAGAQGGSSMDCQSGRDRCVKQCNQNVSRGEEAAPVTGAYGAIAYDKETGAWGMADASKDKSSAKQSALGYCVKHGPNCEIVESFSNTCAAVAAGTNNRLGWAVNKNARQAGLDAIEKCGKNANGPDKSRCFLQLYHCYSE